MCWDLPLKLRFYAWKESDSEAGTACSEGFLSCFDILHEVLVDIMASRLS